MSVATRPGQPSWADVNRDVARTVSMPGNTYFAWMCLVALILGCGVLAWAFQIWTGMGAAGKRTPQMWAMYITTFVFWIGIGHAGTLISAILYLFRAKWRTSIYRGAEAMTVFAVMTAGLFPLIHAGRMWFAYWLTPYPNQRYLWPNFKSPLVWDVFAISTYLTISVVFFLVGLVPDVAALRDQSTGIKKKIYAVISLGWEGSDSQWRHYRRAYGLLAALATPLVLSVHSVVSFDFAMALVPGWHSTLFAPFFVDGAIFSGFAMVLLLMLPMRYLFNWYDYITDKHLDVSLDYVKHREQSIDIGQQNVGRVRQLHRKASVEHIARGHSLMHEARLGADMLGEVGQKGDHVMAGLALDLVDALGLEAAALPDGASGALGDDPQRRLGIASMRLDLEPDPVAVLRRPDPRHRRL